jgi:hypothetical protein
VQRSTAASRRTDALDEVGHARRAAGLGDDEFAEFLAAGFEHLGHADQERGALGGLHPRPRSLVEGRPSGLDRAHRRLGRSLGHPADDFFRGRVDDLDGRQVVICHPGAVDVEIGIPLLGHGFSHCA